MVRSPPPSRVITKASTHALSRMQYKIPLANAKTMRTCAQLLAALIVLACFVSTNSAENASPKTLAVGTSITASSLPSWSTFVNLCATVAPYCGVACFLAPLPTIAQVSRDKTVGHLPLLPYSSMIANGVVWVLYGRMKGLPSVWGSNVVGVALGTCYLAVFVKHCGPLQANLPGTIGQHLKGVGAVVFLNLCLVAGADVETAADVIGKEGVLFCVVLFASPLAALRTVIATRSAASIPLPFTVACLVNCTAWLVMGWWQVHDFNIYFPNALGLLCAVTQLALKGLYGNRASGRSPGTQELPK